MSTFGYKDQPFVSEFYDAVFSNYLQDFTFWLEYAKEAGGRTLELACGTGRVLLPLAQAGIEITGLDYSNLMLDVCRQKLSQLPADARSRVKLVQGNMADFETQERYSLVIIPGRSFHHLVSPSEQKGCLRCVAAHLNIHGKLIIHVYHPDFPRLHDPKYLKESIRVSGLQLADGRKLDMAERIAVYHKDMQYNEVEIIYYLKHADGRQERLVHGFASRYFFRYEMEHLLRLCGFKVVELFGKFDKSQFTSESPEMIFVAEMV